MGIARGMLVITTAIGVIGAAQANAPELNLNFITDRGPNVALAVPGDLNAPALFVANHTAAPHFGAPGVERTATGFIQQSSPQAYAASAATAQAAPQRRETALMVLVAIGLIAYQLRRKHRFLRPHAIALNS